MNQQKLETAVSSPQKEQHKISRKQRLARFGGSVVTAGLVVIPVADYATSDVISAKVYNTVQDEVHLGSRTANSVAVDGLIGLGIAAQCVALSTAFTKSKKLSGIKGGFEEYIAEREKTMSLPRKALSKTVNAPYAGIIKIGGGFEKLGTKIENSSDSQIVKNVGSVIVDTGKVNAMGPPMAAMQETVDGNPPSLARNIRLGSLFAGSWVGLAEGIKQIYRNVPPLRPPMAFVGETFQTMTTMDIAHPWETPIGSTTLTAAAVGLAVTGWRVAAFNRQRETGEIIEPVEFPRELLPFPEANPGAPLLDTEL